MGIKYEIHSLKNASGDGEERNFARIFENEPITADELKSRIESACTLTKADVEATLSALRVNIVRELSMGNRFHIPGIGYFSLSTKLEMPDNKTVDKVRGDYIRVKSIKFRREESLLQEVKLNVRFEKADFSTKSKNYGEEAMLAKIKAYLADHGVITRSDMEREFGIRQTTALKWLKHFVETGDLEKIGARNSPAYMRNYDK